ncbi:MAG: glyceraldehyde-3-phosphate dehydrogenase, partial [Candidatus Aenigmatarchaeota archaeon]
FDKHVPSHHAIDVKTVMKNLNIFSMAVKVPTTLAHVHVVDILAKRETSVEEVVNAFKEHSRIILLDSKDYLATSTIIERFRDLFRPRNDMYEVAVINGLINVEKNRIRYLQVVHQEAIVIPENVDAIRAMTGIEKNKWKSIEKTNKSLGIGA